MASQLHTYTAHVSWNGGREGSGSISNDNSGQGYDILVPTEFGGPGGALNPEELLTDAIAGCYSITFGIVATNRRIPLKGVQVEAVGTVEQSGANFVYKSVALSPRITLGAEATEQDIATAVDMAHKADAYCIVTNAVRGKVEVSIKPSVQREGEAAQETKPVSGDETLDSPYLATGATSVTDEAEGTTASAATPSTSSETKMPENNPTTPAAPGTDTAPKPGTSYEGTQQTEDAYAEAGEAQKPRSATSTTEGDASSQNGATTSDSSSTSGTTDQGANPENSEADDVTASSQQTGNPDAMQVGAVPG